MLHKPLLGPTLGGSKFGVHDEVTVCRPRRTLRSPSSHAGRRARREREDASRDHPAHALGAGFKVWPEVRPHCLD